MLATYIAFAVMVSFLTWTCSDRLPFLQKLELNTLDMRYRLRPPIAMSPHLMTLDIDKATIDRAGSWPISRRFYAEFLYALKHHDARLMSLDIFFPDVSPLVVQPTDVIRAQALLAGQADSSAELSDLLDQLAYSADGALIEALEATRMTIMAQTFTTWDAADDASADTLEQATQIAWAQMKPEHQRSVEMGTAFAIPFDGRDTDARELARASNVEPPAPHLLAHATGLGFAQVIPDIDGLVRKYPLFMHYKGRLYPSLALMSTVLATGASLQDITVEPGRVVRIRNVTQETPDGQPKQSTITIPVDHKLRMMANWTGDYLDTFRHVPASVLLRFRAVDLVRQHFREARQAGLPPLEIDVAAIASDILNRKLLTEAEAAPIIQTLLLAELVSAAMAGSPGGKLAFLDDVAGPEGSETRTLLDGLWEIIAVNRRMLVQLQAAPDTPYATLTASENLPPDRLATHRHAADMLRHLVKRGKDIEAFRPLYFFDPVEVTSGDHVQHVSPLDLADKLVFVGLTATGTHDFNPMPFSPRYPMVGLHVNATNSLLTQQFIGFFSPWTSLWLTLALALVLALVVPHLHPFVGAAFLVVLNSLGLTAAIVAFNHHGAWLPAASPIAAGTVTYLGIVVHAFLSEINEKKRAREDHLRYKTQVESELRVASEIQESALPRTFPPFPNRSEFELHAAMDPAREVGGDLFDFFFVDAHHLFFHVGDVSGKGVPAALFMMITQTLVRSEAMRGGSPADVLARVNDLLAHDNDTTMFVTMLCGTLDTRTGAIDMANAGHNPPLKSDPQGDLKYMNLTANRLLGILEGSDYAVQSTTLAPGDVIFFYTDGVTEASDRAGRLFSDPRLETTLAGQQQASMTGLIDHVRSAIAAFTRGAPPSDDVTMLALRYNGRPAGDDHDKR